MILRRPKRRASTEKAPGPNSVTASKTVTDRMTENLSPNRFGAEAGSGKARADVTHRAASTAAIGVKNPTSSMPPVINATRPTAHARASGSDSSRYSPP